MRFNFFIIIFIIFGFLAFNFSSAESPSSLDLQSLIRDLQVQIQTLQAQVKTLEAELGVKQEPAVSQAPSSAQAPSPVSPQAPSVTQTASQDAIPQSQPEPTTPELTRSLSRGSSGDDVRKLQEFLAKDKEIYPEGLITGFFGPKTESAVKKWQEKQGIESVGIVGPKTIARFKDIGKGVIQGLLSQGAGQSNIIPPGLFKKAESPITPTPSGTIPAQPISQTGTTTIPAIPQIPTQISTTTSTTTPSGTIPATPAQPAQPVAGGATVPATPAVPAQPATQTTADTTAPVISNIQATNITSNSFTITWTTNEISDSQVEYGPTWNYGSSTALNTSMVTSHSVPLSGLTPNTSYQIKVKSKDAVGNLGIGTFATVTSSASVSSDITAPTISNVQAININTTGATITWTTNEASDSRADYSSNPTASLDSEASIKIDSAMVTSHSLSLANQLSSGTTYRFRVESKDAAGNAARSSEYSFTSSTTAVTSNLRVTYPNGGEQWYKNNSYTVTWVNPLQAGFSGDGNYRWIVALKKGSTGTEYVGNGSVLVTQSSYTWNTWNFVGGMPDGSDYLAEVILQRNCSLALSQPCPEASAVISGATADFSDNYFTVSSTAPSDTTAPVISNVQATNIATSSATISWVTNESANSSVTYSFDSSFYAGTGIGIATLVTAHSMNLSGLQPASLYYFRVTSIDSAGNEAVSANSTFTTASLPAPIAGDTGTSHLGATFSAGGTAPSYTGTYGLGLRFRYDANSISQVQSFRVYHKKPGASSFSVIATFPNPSSILNGSYIRSGTWGVPDSWTLNYINSSLGPFWEAQTSNPTNLSSSSNFSVGEYNSYVVAVDASGTESQPSGTMKHVILERTSILSPIGNQTASNPTFSWTVASGWPQSPSYYLRMYDTSSVIWSKNVSVSLSASTGSKVYDGPALSVGQTYTVFIDAPGLYYNNFPYTSMNAATQNFSVSSGASLDTDNNLASVLKSLSSVLQKLQKALK